MAIREIVRPAFRPSTPGLCGATSSLAVPTPEFFDAPGGIDDLLLAGIKRMARGADIEVEIIVG